MSQEHRKTVDWALNEIAALELVLTNLKDGLLMEKIRTEALLEAGTK